MELRDTTISGIVVGVDPLVLEQSDGTRFEIQGTIAVQIGESVLARCEARPAPEPPRLISATVAAGDVEREEIATRAEAAA